MNRNVLKIIALLTMIIDHIGAVFFPNVLILRIIGRVAFPIFAFFVAEGYYYTKSKARYVITMLICMVISWAPFVLCFGHRWYVANVIGIFLLSILGMYLIDKIKVSSMKEIFGALFILYLIVLFVLDTLQVMPETTIGVMLPIAFYVFRGARWKQLLAGAVVLVARGLLDVVLYSSWIQMFAVLTMLLLILYNGGKGRLNLKYLFYIGYPLHLIVIWLINIMI